MLGLEPLQWFATVGASRPLNRTEPDPAMAARGTAEPARPTSVCGDDRAMPSFPARMVDLPLTRA